MVWNSPRQLIFNEIFTPEKNIIFVSILRLPSKANIERDMILRYQLKLRQYSATKQTLIHHQTQYCHRQK